LLKIPSKVSFFVTGGERMDDKLHADVAGIAGMAAADLCCNHLQGVAFFLNEGAELRHCGRRE
jgi:hypothetical protein